MIWPMGSNTWVMLPVVATLAMAALSRQSAGQGRVSGAQMSDNIGGLAGFLDVNKDGSIADDMMGFVGKLFGGR